MVALYFAVHDIDINSSDGAFYICNPQKGLTGGIDTEIDVNKHDFCSLIPKKFDQRIIAQSAIMTTHCLPQKLDPFTALDDIENSGRPRIFKFRIRNEFKSPIKFELEMFGIDYAKLFPGLEGIGKNIQWLCKRHPHWEKVIKNWSKG